MTSRFETVCLRRNIHLFPCLPMTIHTKLVFCGLISYLSTMTLGPSTIGICVSIICVHLLLFFPHIQGYPTGRIGGMVFC